MWNVSRARRVWYESHGYSSSSVISASPWSINSFRTEFVNLTPNSIYVVTVTASAPDYADKQKSESKVTDPLPITPEYALTLLSVDDESAVIEARSNFDCTLEYTNTIVQHMLRFDPTAGEKNEYRLRIDLTDYDAGEYIVSADVYFSDEYDGVERLFHSRFDNASGQIIDQLSGYVSKTPSNQWRSISDSITISEDPSYMYWFLGFSIESTTGYVWVTKVQVTAPNGDLLIPDGTFPNGHEMVQYEPVRFPELIEIVPYTNQPSEDNSDTSQTDTVAVSKDEPVTITVRELTMSTAYLFTGQFTPTNDAVAAGTREVQYTTTFTMAIEPQPAAIIPNVGIIAFPEVGKESQRLRLNLSTNKKGTVEVSVYNEVEGGPKKFIAITTAAAERESDYFTTGFISPFRVGFGALVPATDYTIKIIKLVDEEGNEFTSDVTLPYRTADVDVVNELTVQAEPLTGQVDDDGAARPGETAFALQIAVTQDSTCLYTVTDSSANEIVSDTAEIEGGDQGKSDRSATAILCSYYLNAKGRLPEARLQVHEGEEKLQKER